MACSNASLPSRRAASPLPDRIIVIYSTREHNSMLADFEILRGHEGLLTRIQNDFIQVDESMVTLRFIMDTIRGAPIEVDGFAKAVLLPATAGSFAPAIKVIREIHAASETYSIPGMIERMMASIRKTINETEHAQEPIEKKTLRALLFLASDPNAGDDGTIEDVTGSVQ